MKQVVLTEEQLKALDAYLQEIPMKYAGPIVSFLNGIIEGSQAEELPTEELSAE